MSSLKHPATILGIFDLLVIGGVYIYFNRRIGALEEALNKLSKDVEGIVLASSELSTFKRAAEEAIRAHSVTIVKQRKIIVELNERVTEIEDTLAAVVKSLKTSEIKMEIEPP